ncbi:Multifunctional tryptophan biosynthesis protein [Venturia nashicola]|uniref:Multifunctional tryptophan biosynthesis protein n=1 Tax=Venturia nashicola TaxID=86259 RepID=A0A4Z1PDX7_9PEZI|nr:Multifunctional tryptophan biosynthesis protein [Venturia nashicola]TLD38666.1 Multifunctional tryptophan biosynthesis protein [Venturia nashicola]
MSRLSEPVRLPISGVVLKNRLVKAALAESLSKNSQPNTNFESAYAQWGTGGWGAILTGNVMIDARYKGDAGDLAIESDPTQRPIDLWKAYANAIQKEGSPGIVQLNHPGRQSPLGAGSRGLWDKNIAPSAVGLNIGENLVARMASGLVFGTPREMTVQDIDDVKRRFVEAAQFVAEVGFKGIELHAAHGYLLAQFLSPRSNLRTDGYGGSTAKRARIVVEILREIREAVPKGFVVAIKLNSADHQRGAKLDEVMEQIALIVEAGVDFVEISGGSYEDPQMMQAKGGAPKSSAREAFFLDFAHEIRSKFPSVVLMLTGGFRSRTGMESALAENACDIIGLGRPAAINPHFPQDVLLNKTVSEGQATMQLDPVPMDWLMSWVPIKVLGAGQETMYYAGQIHRIAKGLATFAPQARL